MDHGNKVVSLKTGAQLETEPLPAIGPKRQTRIWKMQDLHLGGMRVRDLATFFGVSRKQVYKDLQDAKVLYRALVKDFDSDTFLGREIGFLEELRRKTMHDYAMAKQEGVKLGFLRLAGEISSKLTGLLQSTGLLAAAPQRIMIEQNPFVDKEFRQRYAALLLEARAKGVPIQGL
ncbi:MAG: hypothetical protein HY790_11325 [Deltaproteobacteria bacterium]|nr:hypothetical protein [Deltaproteobacteria bacterium]MBI4796404.1 hypothetical protein [Deltaproteobacteria bacterium]